MKLESEETSLRKVQKKVLNLLTFDGGNRETTKDHQDAGYVVSHSKTQ